MSHTPTPWKVWRNNGVVTDNQHEYGVCEAPDPYDAAFIVKAVNAHDDLVAALKALTGDKAYEGMMFSERAKMARDALAKAGVK